MKTYQRCILILADGSRPDVFEELCDAGQLPNCEALFKNGGRFAPAVSVFPSTTGPAYIPYLTGCYPGTCNVPGIRWFDKKVYGENRFLSKKYRSYVGLEIMWMNHDLQLKTPTLFEIFDSTFSVFSPIDKGSKKGSNKTKHSRTWYCYYSHLTDHWAFMDQHSEKKLLKALDDDFEFGFVVYTGIDEYSHLSYPRHEKALNAYQAIDRTLGKVTEKLKKKGWLDDTLIMIVSDHGLSQTHQHFGVASFLESQKIKTFYYPKIFKYNFEAASMVSGNAMLHLYFRDSDLSKNKGWVGRTSYDQLEAERGPLLEALLEHPAVDLLAGENQDGTVVVCSKKGKSTLQKKGDQIFYHNIQGDALGLNLPPVMTDRESLHLTGYSEYPDAPAQLLQIFKASRTGDWVLSAASGWDLRKRFEHPEHHSSHGALLKEHMHIPFYANVPISSEIVRSCDVYPTILKLMGREIPEGIDGVSLV